VSYLFISRNNVHARYYKELCPQLSLDTEIHVSGIPILPALSKLCIAFDFDFSNVIKSQIKRKQSRSKLFWHLPIVIFIYCHLIRVIESGRLAKYLYLFEKKKPTAVVLWNGKKLPNQTVVEAAKLLNIEIFYFENGLLPNTTSLDPHGVNYSATIPRTAQLLEKFRECPADFISPPITQRKAHKGRVKGKTIELPHRFIFVPFQVPHDTQISQHSPWIKSMEHLFDEVMDAVNSLNDDSLYVVFKEHPSWHKHYEHLYKKHRNALFANNNDTASIISSALAVVTINSTVGFEGLMLKKPVITLGEACFNIEGLVLNALNSSRLQKALKAVEHWQPDSLVTENFFKYLETIYVIPGSWKQPHKEHVTAIEARLRRRDTLSAICSEINK